MINVAGTVLLSTKVNNDETPLLDLIATVIDLDSDGEVCWATDLTDGGGVSDGLCKGWVLTKGSS